MSTALIRNNRVSQGAVGASGRVSGTSQATDNNQQASSSAFSSELEQNYPINIEEQLRRDNYDKIKRLELLNQNLDLRKQAATGGYLEKTTLPPEYDSYVSEAGLIDLSKKYLEMGEAAFDLKNMDSTRGEEPQRTSSGGRTSVSSTQVREAAGSINGASTSQRSQDTINNGDQVSNGQYDDYYDSYEDLYNYDGDYYGGNEDYQYQGAANEEAVDEYKLPEQGDTGSVTSLLRFESYKDDERSRASANFQDPDDPDEDGNLAQMFSLYSDLLKNLASIPELKDDIEPLLQTANSYTSRVK